MNERVTTAGVALKDGKVLVARRIDGGAAGGKWEFPGGKQRYGETVQETLRREWMEEFSADIETGDEIFSSEFTNADTLYHLKCLLVTLLSPSLSLSVHTEVKWVGKTELLSLDFVPSDREISRYLVSADVVSAS